MNATERCLTRTFSVLEIEHVELGVECPIPTNLAYMGAFCVWEYLADVADVDGLVERAVRDAHEEEREKEKARAKRTHI